MNVAAKYFLKQVEPFSSGWPTVLSLLQKEEKSLLQRVKTSAFFLYQDEITVVGAADVVMENQEFTIKDIYIKERFRSQGHGDEVLKKLLEFSKRNGMNSIFLEDGGKRTFWKKI